MPEVRLPSTLPSSFVGLPRKVQVDAATVGEALRALDERWPGLHDRLCEAGPTLRRHIHVYVDGDRAGLDSPIAGASRVEVISAISGG